MEPDPYIAPHRHLAPEKAETIRCPHGRIGVVLFDDAGASSEARVLSASSDCVGVHIPVARYHSLIALE